MSNSSLMPQYILFLYAFSLILLLFFKSIYLAVLSLSCGMQNLVSWPGVTPRAPFPLHWECGVLATEPPGKSPSVSHLLPFHFYITLFAHCENPTSRTTLQIVLTHFLSEKAMAPHSSTLAWQTPWMEEPGRLQSMGSLRVKTRLSDFTFTFMHWRRKWQPTPAFLPGESQGRGSLVGCCLWGRTESDTTEET